jgi:hypothetical protein
MKIKEVHSKKRNCGKGEENGRRCFKLTSDEDIKPLNAITL